MKAFYVGYAKIKEVIMNLIEFKTYCNNQCVYYDKIIDKQIDIIMELLQDD